MSAVGGSRSTMLNVNVVRMSQKPNGLESSFLNGANEARR